MPATNTLGYNPELYWENRGLRYRHREHADELGHLEKFIKKYAKNQKILEVGAGYGRVYKYLISKNLKPDFTMCDFVDSFRNKCKEFTGILPDKWDGKILPYQDNGFHFVISFSVCLHVPFDKIDMFLKEHARVSSNYIFIATWYEGGGVKISGSYCFEHDYYFLFKKYNLEIIEEIKCCKNRRRNWILKKC